MGKLNIGILGGFSGTVGTVIGSTNKKGDDIIRVKSKKPRVNNSQSQLEQQTRFGLVTGFLMPLNFLLKNSFKSLAGDQMSPYNYACQQALKNAIAGNGPDFELDYSKVLVSQGFLSRESNASAEEVSGQVNFQWSDSTGQGKCASTDKAVLLVYNVDQAEVSYSVGATTRGSKSGSLNLPYAQAGDSLLFYLFFQSATDPTVVSTSQLVGRMEIPG